MPDYTMHLVSAFLLSVVLIPFLSARAARIGLVDLPHGRKVHDGAIPRIGGVAMFAAFMLPVIDLTFAVGGHWGLLTALIVLVALGVLDDRFELGWGAKLLGQLGSVILMLVIEPRFLSPVELFGLEPNGSTIIAVAFTVFFVIGITNAVNMIDGLDGLAGGAAAATLFWLAMVAWVLSDSLALAYLLLLLFAIFGFLLFNMRHPWRQRAAVFMGDAGSLMLGAAIAFFIVHFASSTAPTAGTHAAPIVPLPYLLWLVAIPAFDTLILMTRRLISRQNPLVGDRRHLHHLLLDAGLSPAVATALLVAGCGLTGSIGVIGWFIGIPAPLMLLGLVIPFSLHLYFVCVGWKHRQRREWAHQGKAVRHIEGHA